MTLTDYELLK